MGTVHGLPLSLGDAKAVFGAPVWVALGSMVRGGAWVPDIPANAHVPTSKPISIGQLVGATNYTPIIGVTFSGTKTVFMPPSGNANTTITAVPAGGGPSYTYAWARLSGDAQVVFNSGTTSAAVNIADHTPNNTFGSHSALFRCTVSDGTSSAYSDVTISFNGTA